MKRSKRCLANQWIQALQCRVSSFAIGDSLYIRPGWEKLSPDFLVPILVEFGEAFGTGTHALTGLALRNLEKPVFPFDTILDFGRGDGTLSVATDKICPPAKGCRY